MKKIQYNSIVGFWEVLEFDDGIWIDDISDGDLDMIQDCLDQATEETEGMIVTDKSAKWISDNYSGHLLIQEGM